MKCRYGFPHKKFDRDGQRKMHLEKGESEGSWFARFPRNDALCCSYEAHILLANLGNVDWRPCLNLWAVVEYVTKYAMKAPKGSRRLGEVLKDVVNDVCTHVPENQGMDLLRRSLQKFYARTLGERDFGIFEAVHLGLRLPLVFPLLETVTLNTTGARAAKTNAQLRDAGDDEPVTHESKVDKFDKRLQVLNRTAKGDSKALAMADELRYMSLYEFAWKFYVNRGRLCRSQKPVCIMVTPAFSADCANVSHDRHEAYARTAVVAYWRLMPTQKRHEAIMEHQYLRAEDLATTDRRTWGTTEFAAPMGRFLGVQDLVRQFDGRKDRAGKEVGWAQALMEMLVDPMLVAWVPGWVVEQYERWNPKFRGTLRWAKGPPGAPRTSTNAELLRLTRWKMIDVQERRQAEKAKAKAGDEDSDGSSALSNRVGSEREGE